MVTYAQWTSIGYDVAEKKGARIRGEGTQSENQALVSLLADVWNERKAELQSASRSEARNIAQSEIAVS